MSMKDTLSAADRALIEGCAEPDLPSGMPPLAALLQSTSLQLQPGSTDYVEGAAMGDFLVPRDGGFVLVKGSVGIAFVPVGFERRWPQFRPFRQGWTGFTHDEKPKNALWLKPEKTFDKPASPDGKQGLYLVDADGNPGDKIEETLYLHALILLGDGHPPHGVSFAFHSTSLSVGNDFGKRAKRLQAEIDGRPLTGCVVGKWKLSSEYKKSDSGFRWYAPVLSLIDKVGGERGPTITEMLQAARLRASFKAGLAWVAGPERVGPPAPPALVDAGHDNGPEGDEQPLIDSSSEGPDYSDRAPGYDDIEF